MTLLNFGRLGATRWPSPWRVTPPAPTSSSSPHVLMFVILFASLGKSRTSIWRESHVVSYINHDSRDGWALKAARFRPACWWWSRPCCQCYITTSERREPQREMLPGTPFMVTIQGGHTRWTSNVMAYASIKSHKLHMLLSLLSFRWLFRVICTAIHCYVLLLLQHVSITLARWHVCLAVRISPAKSLLGRLHGLWRWFPRSGLLFPEFAFHGQFHFRVQIRRLSKYFCNELLDGNRYRGHVLKHKSPAGWYARTFHLVSFLIPHISRVIRPDWVDSSPIQKKDLVSGNYLLVILSNNGDAEPISYQRNISLSIGPQVTTTVSLTRKDSTGALTSI